MQAVLGQCKKKDVGYKTVAIETAGVIIHSLQVDVFSQFWPLLPVVNPVSKKELTQASVKWCFMSFCAIVHHHLEHRCSRCLFKVFHCKKKMMECYIKHPMNKIRKKQ